MSAPHIAQKGPIPVNVEAGKSYFWCSCGKSANQPFCDGSHQGSDFSPVRYEAEETKRVFFCACKHSGAPVTCDGTHNTL
ncbi:CDGSH iron-sulfur domain-containing protein [Cognatiyoonia sp. IB215182]|uniref:CDGSH iron-sulfur domain-containing protein n=1 Tax=Cognatiyoonia sp. IB215182 TaxID=3097353 RepID=UPI002A11044B|nr:CDGSH iron-sulfur domain-containing protein [Cognatiyoonia sp. IB215182]MDX8351099.1 CDGSH iron-sulfur domain-containing protein [Cognatiyoonia sp. IB215182]